MAFTNDDRKMLKNAFRKLQTCSGNGDNNLEVLLENLNNLVTQLIAEKDFEVKNLPLAKYCCDDGSVYLTFICKKFEDGVEVESSPLIIDATTLLEITTLPACAEICEIVEEQCENAPRGLLTTWGN